MRLFFSTDCWLLNADYPPESSSKNPIPRITKSGKDIAFAVELTIDRGGEDRDFRMLAMNRRDAFGRGHEAHELHALHARFFQEGDRCRSASAGGEHRVDQQHFALRDVRRKLLVISDR